MASSITKVAVAATAAALLTITACSSDSGSSDSASENTDGRGPITYVEGKDTTETGVVRQIIDEWNAANPDEQVTFKEQSNDADQAHDDLVQHLQAEQTDYDVMALDVIWTAEFAAKGWLVPLEGEFALDNAGVLPATVESATYNGTQYAAPKNTNGGLLFYRSDLVPAAPTTWDELTASCTVAVENNIDCYAGQFASYEGLTVNTSEIINAHGGSFVGEDGTTPTVDSPEAKAGLQALVTAFQNNVIPAQDTTFKEPESQQAFEDGKALYLRNWPYVYGTAAKEGSAVAGKYAVAPLPGVTGVGTSTLGGYNAAISAYSEHKATAADFLRFLQGEQAQRIIAEGALPPVLGSLYDDPALIAEMPYLPALKQSIENAVPRPVTPFYPAVSKAVQDNAFAAIKGEKTVDQAIADMQAGIESASSN
ncbi:ABC transporter substrate-binding protein [Rhodococcus sp. BP-252]|uniref:ABC transporter substrate-binding protein n=1 Tax=Rhodococcoides kyotonense TaxID=398843 RepID=A0A177Y7K3_9NOCA|nr:MULTISPECIES: ABC transporter substrate-binding protein [Rhodococcus]MBY6411988.1 ABC transporter substrate-binding protein [Rhodococcus sp. BP-320]MBY6416384.1 ABC transporter substrate-binding protein [Rhodococcus sp. BP-321]MBY6420810.1 ABC transporter substrate-binding protein [Rhodococcus sp. BP-324]MBY6426408.1 ABC transporter substrate-binding protein [Rhodococcus sp. BP-323]MBY6431407.1 ABC transporter substrate-binding protein [Rhodococcus sp. BP-322]